MPFRLTLLLLTLWRLSALLWSPFPVTPDEAQYRFYALTPAWAYYSKPPGLPAIIAASIALLGDTNAAMRCAVPLLHAANALLLAAAVRRLTGNKAAADLTGLSYALLPGVSYSSGLITTDPPMMFGWCLALWGLTLSSRLAIGVGMAAGMLSKYTASVWWLSALLLLGKRRLLAVAALLTAVLLLPHVAALHADGWQTLHHTAANANAGNAGLHPLNLLAFLASQIAVAGGVALLLPQALLHARRAGEPNSPLRFFAAFTAPLLLLMSVQALFSRAHANWAAPAYCAGCALVALHRPQWLARLNRLHLSAALLLPLLNAAAAHLPARLDPGASLRAFAPVGRLARELMHTHHLQALINDDRKALSLLIHHARLHPDEVLTAPPALLPRAGNHYQAAHALHLNDTRALLYVTYARTCTAPAAPQNRTLQLLQRLRADGRCASFYRSDPIQTP